MIVTIQIQTDNLAFGGYVADEVARILQRLAARTTREGLHEAKLRDVNGNTVGTVSITGEDE